LVVGKVWLPLFLTKHYAMMMYGGVEVQVHTVLVVGYVVSNEMGYV